MTVLKTLAIFFLRLIEKKSRKFLETYLLNRQNSFFFSLYPFNIKILENFIELNNQFNYTNSNLFNLNNQSLKNIVIAVICNEFKNYLAIIKFLKKKKIPFECYVDSEILKNNKKLDKILSINEKTSFSLISKGFEDNDLYSKLRNEIEVFKKVLNKPINSIYFSKNDSIKDYNNDNKKKINNIQERYDQFDIEKNLFKDFKEIDYVRRVNDLITIKDYEINRVLEENTNYVLYLDSKLWYVDNN